MLWLSKPNCSTSLLYIVIHSCFLKLPVQIFSLLIILRICYFSPWAGTLHKWLGCEMLVWFWRLLEISRPCDRTQWAILLGFERKSVRGLCLGEAWLTSGQWFSYFNMHKKHKVLWKHNFLNLIFRDSDSVGQGPGPGVCIFKFTADANAASWRPRLWGALLWSVSMS